MIELCDNGNYILPGFPEMSQTASFKNCIFFYGDDQILVDKESGEGKPLQLTVDMEEGLVTVNFTFENGQWSKTIDLPIHLMIQELTPELNN